MAEYTLFIPDISGFTRFVKTTEISHSKHIIEELITLIIDQVGSAFEVAEIEGDAVFFYSDKLYGASEVIDLSKKVFIAFHSHLLNYQHNRICNCGACSTAIDLNLKFVVHCGMVSLAEYGKRAPKPFGDSVIAIHRLLKNDVPSDEYVLLSNNIPSVPSLKVDGQGVKKEQDLGDIPYRFLLISKWKEEASYDISVPSTQVTDLQVAASKDIAMDAHLVHHFISDFRYRKLWNKDANEIIYDSDKINQAGTEHYCVIKGKDLYFDTIKPTFDQGLSYGEVLKTPAPFKYVEIKFLITQEGPQSSKITLIMAVSFKWLFHHLLTPIFSRGLKKQVNQTLDAIKVSIEDPALSLTNEVSASTKR